MANINTKIQPLSEWLTYELEPNSVLQNPVIRLRVAPAGNFVTVVRAVAGDSLSDICESHIIEYIREWDLTEDDKPVECNPGTKEANRHLLRILLGTRIKDTKLVLGLVLLTYIQTPENFLKN